MSFDDYRTAWQGASESQSNVEQLVSVMAREERRRRVLMAVFGTLAAVALLFTLVVLALRRPLPLAEVVPTVLVQVLLTLSLAMLTRRRRLRSEAMGRAGLAIREASEAGLAAVKSEMRDIRMLSVVAIASIVLLVFAVMALLESGKMNAQAAVSFASLCAVVLAGNAAFQWSRYQGTLLPRRARFEEILAGLREES